MKKLPNQVNQEKPEIMDWERSIIYMKGDKANKVVVLNKTDNYE